MERVENCCSSATGTLTCRSSARHHKNPASEASTGAKEKGLFRSQQPETMAGSCLQNHLSISETLARPCRGSVCVGGVLWNSGYVQFLSSALGWSPGCLLRAPSRRSVALRPVLLLSFRSRTCRRRFCWLRCEYLTFVQFL